MRERVDGRMRHPVLAGCVAAAILLGVDGCANQPTPAATALVVRVAELQSRTIAVRLNQVLKIDTRALNDRYTPMIADERIATVVLRRDDRTKRFEPEVVPHRSGTTQVALIGASPLDTVGFTVVVSP